MRIPEDAKGTVDAGPCVQRISLRQRTRKDSSDHRRQIFPAASEETGEREPRNMRGTTVMVDSAAAVPRKARRIVIITTG
jgi:hypothetical protein